MNKEEIKSIAALLVNHIYQLTEADTPSTAGLLEEHGLRLRDFNERDLLEIHYSLVEVAKERGITLDLIRYDDTVVGMPYNLQFDIHFNNEAHDEEDDSLHDRIYRNYCILLRIPAS